MEGICQGILVVEDDSSIRESLTLILESDGHRVISMTNGRDAVKYLETHESPCFVFLDLMMPVMDGWEFLKIREKSHRLIGIPVVVMSAIDPKQARGQTATIRKPFELEAVAKFVNHFCKHHRSACSA